MNFFQRIEQKYVLSESEFLILFEKINNYIYLIIHMDKNFFKKNSIKLTWKKYYKLF